MPGAEWLWHNGVKILFIDFSHSDAGQIVRTVVQAKPMISAQPEQSVRCLVDTTGSAYSMETATALKDFTMHNKPYMKIRGQAKDHSALSGFVRRLYQQPEIQDVRILNTAVAAGSRYVDFNLAIVVNGQEANT